MFKVVLCLNCTDGSMSVKGTIYVHLRGGGLNRVELLEVLIFWTIKGLIKRVEAL